MKKWAAHIHAKLFKLPTLAQFLMHIFYELRGNISSLAELVHTMKGFHNIADSTLSLYYADPNKGHSDGESKVHY